MVDTGASTTGTHARLATIAAAEDLRRLQRKIQAELSEAACADRPGAFLLGAGSRQISKRLVEVAARSKEVLAVRPAGASAEAVLAAYRDTSPLIERGVRFLSLYDVATAEETREVIGSLPGPNYHFCHGPLQIKILDRLAVVLAGPDRGGDQSVMLVTRPEVVHAALRYFTTVYATAVSARLTGPTRRVDLTNRQELIAALLSEDLSDVAIAARLSVSLRTVQAEIGSLYSKLGVRSRFGAGLALAAEWNARLTLSPPTLNVRTPGDAAPRAAQGLG